MVHGPIRLPAAGIVEEPVVVDVAIGIVGDFGRGPQPEIPVQLRRRVTIRWAAKPRVHIVEVPNLDLTDPAQFAGLDRLDRLPVVRPRMLLRAQLHDAAVLARGLDHRSAFTD